MTVAGLTCCGTRSCHQARLGQGSCELHAKVEAKAVARRLPDQYCPLGGCPFTIPGGPRLRNHQPALLVPLEARGLGDPHPNYDNPLFASGSAAHRWRPPSAPGMEAAETPRRCQSEKQTDDCSGVSMTVLSSSRCDCADAASTSKGESGSCHSERVSGEIRDRLAERLDQLTPEQRAAARTVMRLITHQHPQSYQPE